MKMKTLVAALSGAFLIGAATLAPAQKTPSEPAKAVQPSSMENKTAGISGDQYKQEKDRIEADAKAAKEACKSMKDNAKDICEAEAKGKEKLAKKELDLKKNPNDKKALMNAVATFGSSLGSVPRSWALKIVGAGPTGPATLPSSGFGSRSEASERAALGATTGPSPPASGTKSARCRCCRSR